LRTNDNNDEYVVVVVTISGVGMGDEGAKWIADLIRTNSSIRILHFSNYSGGKSSKELSTNNEVCL